jgi:tRNA(Ile)-lysidine synthase
MGASPTPPRADPPRRRADVAVAASGGRDSTALLHATVAAGRELGIQVHALHVHHGLQPQADGWAAQVRAQCRRWGASFHWTRLDGRPAAAESVEAWARRERYAALARMARAAGCDAVLLAHHRRDQAETVLLQLMRGAGARGLAAMPVAAQRDGITWLRPWRDRPREAIEAYVRRHRLAWVDDRSNDDPRFARNRLRLDVWPALERAFPGAEAALAFAAGRAADEAAAQRELALLDAPSCIHDGALVVKAWLTLSPARRTLQLRHVIEQWIGRGAPETLVRRLMAELPRCPSGEWPAPGGVLRLRRGSLAFVADGSVSGRRQRDG